MADSLTLGMADVGGRLSRSISYSNMAKREVMKKRLTESLAHKDGDDRLIYVRREMASYSNYMLNYYLLAPNLMINVCDNLVDGAILRHLEDTKALNYFTEIRHLYPLQTSSDGNCLLHAVSLAMWSFTDHNALLRRLLYVAMVSEENELYRRWKQRQVRIDRLNKMQRTKEEFQSEWHEVRESAEDIKSDDPNQLPYKSLEHIHIFALSNVLRRPLVVISDSRVHCPTGSIYESDEVFDGVYLPLLWKPEDCISSPLVLGYGHNHFVPLLGMDYRLAPDNKIDAVPLVKHNLEQRPVLFLLEDENAGVLLDKYLNLVEIKDRRVLDVPLLCAKLQYNALDENENLLWDYFNEIQRLYRYKNGALEKKVTPQNSPEKQPLIINLSENEEERIDIRKPPETQMDEESMLHETCRFDNCYYKITPESKPFCETHGKKKVKESPEQEAMETSQSAVELNLSELINTCKFSGCVNPTPLSKEFCSKHEKEHKHKCKGLCKKGQKGQEAESCKRLSCNECYAKEPLYIPPQKCTTEDCTNPGTPRFNNLCEQCVNNYGLESQDLKILAKLPRAPTATIDHAVPLLKCKVEDCFAAGTDSSLGYCSKHFLLLYKNGNIGIPTEVEVRLFREKVDAEQRKRLTASWAEGEQKRRRNPSGIPRKEKELCSTPHCAGVRLNTGDLCYQCNRNKKINRPIRPVVFPNFNLPLGDEEQPMDVTGNIIESSGHSPAHSPPRRCVGPACSNQGQIGCNGLCQSCYSILQTYNAEVTEMPPAIQLTPKIDLKEVKKKKESTEQEFPAGAWGQEQAPVQCRKRDCKYTGSPVYKGYCSRCMEKLKAGLILSDESRRAIMKCKNTLCDYMETQDVLDRLYSKQVFRYQQKEECEHIPVRYQKCEYILNQLLDRGDERAFAVFVQVLEEGGQGYLANLLRVERDGTKGFNTEPSSSWQPVFKRPEEHGVGGKHIKLTEVSGPTSVVAKPCISRSCDRFGAPEFHGYCSACAKTVGLFKKDEYQPKERPTMHQEESSSEASLLCVSNSGFEEATLLGKERRTCNRPGCTHWPNPVKNGYCNEHAA